MENTKSELPDIDWPSYVGRIVEIEAYCPFCLKYETSHHYIESVKLRPDSKYRLKIISIDDHIKNKKCSYPYSIGSLMVIIVPDPLHEEAHSIKILSEEETLYLLLSLPPGILDYTKLKYREKYFKYEKK